MELAGENIFDAFTFTLFGKNGLNSELLDKE